MALVEIVETICREQMQDLAQTIEGELKAECPKRSGQAAASIKIEQTSETSYRIGSNDDHLFFADQGNNQSKRIIYPKGKAHGGANVLVFTDGSFHGSARTYEGKHFVRDVANRHR